MAKIKIELRDVVSAESVIVRTYPQWSDYGCLTNAVRIVRKNESGEYIVETYITEDVDAWIDYYDINIINYIPEEKKAYLKQEAKKRIGKEAMYAEPGDTIEVVKGRKFPIGSKFVVKEKYEWKDRYGRTQGYYWITETGEKVPMFNCIITE